VDITRLSWRQIGQWFKQEWRRTPVVGMLTLLVAIAAATFGYWNYRLQIGRPEVEPVSAYLWKPPHGNLLAQITWQNRGKQPARQGFVTFYAADEAGSRQNKLGEGRMEWGNGLIPPSVTSFNYDLGDGQLPDQLLICVVYYNESTKYRQAFRFHFLSYSPPPGGPSPNPGQLEEVLPRPSPKGCRR
jgi:hypothetical protein